MRGLRDLDAARSRLTEQHSRNGLSAFQERLERCRGAHETAVSRHDFVQQEAPRLEALVGAGESQWEEQALELMLERDSLPALLDTTGRELAEAEKELLEAQPDESLRRTTLGEKLEALDLERRELRSQLDAEVLDAYDSAVSAYGDGVAEGRGSRCGRCRLEISSEATRQLRLNQAEICGTCGALLVQSLR